MKHRREKLEAVFEAAAALESDGQRREYLERACPNEEMRREVESLLEAMDNPDSLFDRDETVSEAAMFETPVVEQPGTRIDRYKLLQKVGEGGMGVVYMAEQTEPVTRKVALKIIKLGMDTRQVVARFEAERQALAMMDHPNIARVLDAGATGTGRPYFVMELVRGVSITEYCDKNKLSTRQRLELFMPVCLAIHHAHQKGIIHRDIKPSNVMVTLHDGNPVPKVIDFGIAKATNQKLTERTLFTNYAQMIGTPAYMSPEQAELSGLDVDTRTDVYSLGVLLYELLTGTTPFPLKELMSMGYGEMQRIIAEQEPPKPSTRLSTMEHEELTVVADRRKMEKLTLRKQLEGDLDWIVMRALEKDRTHRYESVDGFVSDIGRHLNDEPVVAAAPTIRYRVRKFCRRNRAVVRLAAATAGLLILAAVIATVQAVRATQAKRDVEAAMERLERETLRGDAIADFMIKILEESVPDLLQRGRISSARKLMDQADTLASTGLADAPAAEFRLRLILWSHYFWAFDDMAASKDQGERIGPLLEKLSDEELGVPRAAAEMFAVSARLWGTKPNGPDAEEAEVAIREMRRIAAQAEATPDTSGRAGSNCLGSLAAWYTFLGDPDDKDYARVIDAVLADATRLFAQENEYFNDDQSDSERFRWIVNVLRQISFRVRSFGFPLPKAAPLLPEMPELPQDPQPNFIYTFYKALNAQCKFAQFNAKTDDAAFEEAVVFLTATEEAIREAGWPARHGTEVVLLKAWAQHKSGAERDVAEAVLKVGTNPDVSLRVWANATEFAASLSDQAVYEQLRLEGFARFASEVGEDDALLFCSVVLLRPLSIELREIVDRILVRAGMPRDPKGIGLLGLAAIRSGKYEAAIDYFDQYVGINFDGYAFGPLLTQLRDMSWGWRMVRAMALAESGKDEAALSAYEKAIAVRQEFAHKHPEFFGSHDVLMHEAERVLTQKGILPTESESP